MLGLGLEQFIACQPRDIGHINDSLYKTLMVLVEVGIIRGNVSQHKFDLFPEWLIRMHRD